jgi:hypothetical protein
MLKYCLAAILMITVYKSKACDACGCSSNTSSFGILPGFQQNFIGMRYQYRSFKSYPHHTNGEDVTGSTEFYQTTELWGRYIIKKRIQVFGFVPYNEFGRNVNGKLTNVNGLGDASLVVNGLFINSVSGAHGQYRHALMAGFGLKMPTGKFELVREGLLVNRNLQPGTGTFDIPVNASYFLRTKQWGINLEGMAVKTGTNRMHYKPGNRASAGGRLYLWKKYKNINFIPQTGVNYEWQSADKENGKSVTLTGGNATYAGFGMDAYYKKIGINFFMKLPISQNINEGYTANILKLSAGLVVLL